MPTVDGYLALDMDQLNNIWWSPGSTTRLTFRHGSEEIASIAIENLDQNRIVLKYRYNLTERIADPINIVYLPNHFGGVRRWFICPSCNQRKGVLYCSRYFRCRTCLGLSYPSQRKTSLERRIDRISQRRRNLGGSGSLMDPFPPKPKRMHGKTYSRLVEEDQRDCAQYFSTWVAAFDRRVASLK
jgi:hypothetical protein